MLPQSERIHIAEQHAARMRMQHPVKDTLQIRGLVMLWMNDEEEPYAVVPNLITDAGHILAAELFQEATRPALVTQVEMGTGTTDFMDATQTTLATAVTPRKAATVTRTDNAVTLAVTFDPGEATGTLTEIGCFNATSGGTMFARTQVQPARVKTDLDMLVTTWVFTF